jgi:hypothetical protein
MTSPTHEKRSLVAPYGTNARKIWRLAIFLILAGLGFMVIGEVSNSDQSSRLGIWMILGAFGLAIVSKAVSYFERLREYDRELRLSSNNALEQTREE